MKFHSRKIAFGFAIASSMLLTACGGGGNSGSTASTLPNAQIAPSITISNSKDVGAQAYSGADALNSQVSAGSGLVTGVSINTVNNGLIDTALRQLHLALDKPIPNLAVGVSTSNTETCSGGGTVSIIKNIVNKSTLSAGDTVSITSNNCVEDGARVNGTLKIVVNSFSGTFSDNSAWNASFGMTFTDFSIEAGGIADTAHGDLTLTYNQTALGVASFSANGKSLRVGSVKGSSTTERTITNYTYSGSVNGSNVYTYRVNFTLSGNLGKLGNVSYTVKTITDFKKQVNSFPSTGALVVTAADKSSVTLTVLNSTTVQLAVDKNGDGQIDETTTTTWTELNSLL